MSFEKRYLVGPSESEALIQKHKQTWMDNNVLIKAVKVAAKSGLVLNSKLPEG